jgi:hypothetical protein
VVVNRRTLRGFLIVAMVVSAGFAAWSWFRPYAWNVDPDARCVAVGCQLKRDRSNYWLDVHLKVNPGETHDLLKPVLLLTAGGGQLESADTTLGGAVDGGTSEVWLKFWLEGADLEGPLKLRINDGSLVLKATSGTPDLGASNLEYFVTNHW